MFFNKKLLAAAALVSGGMAIAANVIISPNMGMPVPVVGTDPGPDWANNINASLSIIDSHDHTPGYGVPIPPAGLDLNSDLTFKGNNATNLRSARFSPQAAPIAGASDLGAIYESGVDLYYNDGSGNQVRITQGGSVTGSSGTITGLPSGTASASFAGSTFTFQSATNTPAIMAVGPVKIGTNTASPKTVTIAPPGGLAANYNMTTPNGVPVATSVLQWDSSGNMSSLATTGSGNAVLATSPTIASPTITSPTITGTISGSPTISGTPTLSGATTITGTTSSPSLLITQSSSGSKLKVGSTGDLTVDNSGNVGVGTSAPSGGLLNVQGNSSSPAVFIQQNSSGSFLRVSSADYLVVSSSGKVGIGSATPAAQLDVTGSASVSGHVTTTYASLSGTGGNTPHACTVRSNVSSIAPNSVTCSAGEIVTGGGCDMPDASYYIRRSYPSASTTWQCTYSANGVITNTAYAVCCSI